MTVQEILSYMKRGAELSRAMSQEDPRLEEICQTIRECKDMTFLRRLVTGVEQELKQLAGGAGSESGFEEWTSEQAYAIRDLLGWRHMLLNHMMRPTEAEVHRLEYLNRRLREECRKFHQEVIEANRQWQSFQSTRTEGGEPNSATPDGSLYFYACEGGDEVVSLPEDDYYGSDFPYMLKLISHTIALEGDMPIDTYVDGSCLDDELDDWTTGNLRQPDFSHIRICHAVHSLYDHLNYSIPDILRMGKFWKEITLTYYL